MTIDISLGELFLQTFGYATKAFDPKFSKVVGDNKFSRVETGAHGSPYYATDLLGREYYLPMEVQVGLDNAEALGVTDAYGGVTGRWMLPYPIISLDMKKRIVKTDLIERNGPVMELVNTGGWDITVKGLLINKDNEFPEADFTTLVRLCNLNKVIRLNNPVTDIVLKGVGGMPDRDVVIESISFPETKGVKHVRGYLLKMCSNEPFNLIDLS